MQSLQRYLFELRFVFNDAIRFSLFVVVAMMLLMAVMDLFSIGLLVPFIATVTGQTVATQNPKFNAWMHYFDINTLGFLIVLFFVLKSILAYWLQRKIVQFTEAERVNLMTRLMDQYLHRPYEFHLSRSSTESVNTLFWHASSVSGLTLGGLLRVATDLVVSLAIVILLWTLDPFATSTLAIFLFALVLIVTRLVRKELRLTSSQIAHAHERALASLNNALGAFKEIRVLGTADAFRSALADAANELSSATARQNALNIVPKATIEAGLVTFLVALCLFALSKGGNQMGLLPMLGAMAVAAMRLMPIATSMMSSVNGLRSSRFALGVVANELGVDLKSNNKINVDSASVTNSKDLTQQAPTKEFRQLELDTVTYRYPNSAQDSLRGITMQMRNGEVLGIVGRSGAGKTTLIDLLLGLIEPSAGLIKCDGAVCNLSQEAWQRRCAYIPQDVFIVSASLRHNITFGHDDDVARLENALKMARLDDFVRALPMGLDTEIGERGKSLSGGQRQRLAIARALYFDRSILVMDEATSALDAQTEIEIAETISRIRGSRSIILITHREQLLKVCDRVLTMQDGLLEQ